MVAADTMEELRKIYESSPFNNDLGIRLESFEEGAVCYSLMVSHRHQNVNNAVHGGVYFSILDSVMGATIRSVTRQRIVTINSTIHFLAPLTEGNKIVAKAVIIQKGKSIVTAEGYVSDAAGTPLARMVGTFKIIKGREETDKR